MTELAMACNQATAPAQHGRKTPRYALILITAVPLPADPTTV
ncbi:hypothetical protein [Sphingomonas cynarae]